MFRRRKKRSGGQWLPLKAQPFNTSNVSAHTALGSQNSGVTLTNQNFNVSPVAASGAVSVPLTVADQPNLLLAGSAAAVLASYNAQNAADVQGYGYALKRIVGAMWVGVAPSINAQATTPSAVLFGAGLMVRAVDPENPDVPALAGAAGDQASPLTLDSNQDPWIWRRCWLFSPGNAGGAVNPVGADDEWSPLNSVFDAGNQRETGKNCTASIDQQTRRTVKNEERLFLTVDLRAVGINPDSTVDSMEVAWGMHFDYRLFGRMFPTKGNRRNASR